MKRLCCAFSLLAVAALAAEPPVSDHTHFSKVFGENRNYRVILPPDYETSGKRYPVVYYWHSHSDRYTVENHDRGRDTIPRMTRFVAGHDLIIVCPDGYVARDYKGFYGGTPYDVMAEGGDYDFGEYFRELVAHIDANYRTLSDRGHRATSGLSMGGFMSLYVSARYPDRVGSASAFNPGPEFYTGEKGARMLWRPKDHTGNHAHSMVRLVRASGDYISQYHEETREAYARSNVRFEFRQDEYHRHWATSIEETLEFHLRAFATAELRHAPPVWNYTSSHRSFDVWGYHVEARREGAGLTCLEDVSKGGFRLRTRRWAPDGAPVKGCRVRVATAPLYGASEKYELLTRDLSSGVSAREQVSAGADGRLVIDLPGSGVQVSIHGPGAGAQAPVLLPVTGGDYLRLAPGREVALPIRIYNPRATHLSDVKVSLTSDYATVEILSGQTVVSKLGGGDTADLSSRMRVKLTSGAGYFERARLRVNMTYDGSRQAAEGFDVLIVPSLVPKAEGVEILDGRTMRFRVFRQKGNQGGGSAVEREVTEGKGNGNGRLEPGEEATVWVRMRQGMDPFDKDTWGRAKVYCDSPHVTEVARIEDTKQREWTGARELTSVIRLDPAVPPGAVIPLLLGNESWSFRFTPDVRYGAELLYQAFQQHTDHLHAFELRVP
jgi:predicted alpha/beta superfamily hydrolase